MPAKTFFAMLNNGSRVHEFHRDTLLVDLIDVASVAVATGDWINDLKTHYFSRINSYFDEKAFVVEEMKPTTKEYQERAGLVLKEIFAQKARLEGHV